MSEPGPVFSGVELTSARSRKVYRLRRVVYRDQLRYVFVTNNTTWVAKTIADLYKLADRAVL